MAERAADESSSGSAAALDVRMRGVAVIGAAAAFNCFSEYELGWCGPEEAVRCIFTS